MIYLVLALLALGLSGSRAVPQESQITFHSSSNLVLVDVIARNAKNGLPDKP